MTIEVTAKSPKSDRPLMNEAFYWSLRMHLFPLPRRMMPLLRGPAGLRAVRKPGV